MRSANLSVPLEGFRLHNALLGLNQASGLAGGPDYATLSIPTINCSKSMLKSIFSLYPLKTSTLLTLRKSQLFFKKLLNYFSKVHYEINTTPSSRSTRSDFSLLCRFIKTNHKLSKVEIEVYFQFIIRSVQNGYSSFQ